MKTSAAQSASRHATTKVALFTILWVGLAAALLASAGTGQLAIPPSEVLGSLLHRIGLDWLPLPAHPAGDQTLWAIRFPRVVGGPRGAAGRAAWGPG